MPCPWASLLIPSHDLLSLYAIVVRECASKNKIYFSISCFGKWLFYMSNRCQCSSTVIQPWYIIIYQSMTLQLYVMISLPWWDQVIRDPVSHEADVEHYVAPTDHKSVMFGDLWYFESNISYQHYHLSSLTTVIKVILGASETVWKTEISKYTHTYTYTYTNTNTYQHTHTHAHKTHTIHIHLYVQI